MSFVQARAEEMMSRHGFLGVPTPTFAQGGRSHFISLLREGLNPESKVHDIGCGVLRVAYWLIRFLDSGCYHGIEPVRQRIDYGRRYLFTPEEVNLKQPRFDCNPDFNSSVFGTRFDFFLAVSIWTHTSKRQMQAMLDSFIRGSTPAGVFLTSYFPAHTAADDYQGDTWVGTSHQSNTPGVICHSLSWIVEQCQCRGLHVEELPGMDCDSQFWLRIRHQEFRGQDLAVGPTGSDM